jgi:hypothetical protein
VTAAAILPADVLTGAEQLSLPPGCKCGYAHSHADGLWHVISRARCPLHAAAARDQRMRELAAMPKRALITIYRPHCLWTANPLDKWSRDDLIASILAAEYPTEGDPS